MAAVAAGVAAAYRVEIDIQNALIVEMRMPYTMGTAGGSTAVALRHCRIDQCAQITPEREACCGAHHLGHEYDCQIFFRIDPERGRCRTTPEVLTRRAGHARQRWGHGHGAAERKAECH